MGIKDLILFFGGFLTLVLASCSSKNQNVFNESAKSKNAYFNFYKQQSSEFSELLAKSSFHLLRGSQEIFLSLVHQPESAQGFFKSLPPTFVHGDFHIDQVARIDGVITLDDLDTGDWGPFFIDLVRAESSAQVIAEELGFKNFQNGACTESYFDELGEKKLNSVHAAFPAVPEKAEKKGPYQPLVWPSGVDAKLSDENLKKLKQHFQKNYPSRALVEMKKTFGGVGSFRQEKFMVKSDENLFFEYKLLEASPLKNLLHSARSSKMPPCERFQLSAKLFRPLENFSCLTLNDKSYSLIPYVESYEVAQIKTVANEKELAHHTAWMCKELAKVHQKSWGPGETQKIQLTIQNNPLLVERIHMLAAYDAKLIREAFRMILESKESE